VTTILAPAATAENVSTADQIIEALAVYVDEHSGDTGGGHQRTMLLAALIVRLFDVTPRKAIDLAHKDAFDPRVKVAGQARDHILDRVHRARLTAQDDAWTPEPGDTVIWADQDWIVQGWEDDDTVWIHRPDARIFPTIGRTSSGLVDLAGWREEPEGSELVAVADLRPADAVAVTR
jgi:hypothetical protein